MSWLVVPRLDDDYDLFSNYIINYLGLLFIFYIFIVRFRFINLIVFFEKYVIIKHKFGIIKLRRVFKV